MVHSAMVADCVVATAASRTATATATHTPLPAKRAGSSSSRSTRAAVTAISAASKAATVSKTISSSSSQQVLTRETPSLPYPHSTSAPCLLRSAQSQLGFHTVSGGGCLPASGRHRRRRYCQGGVVGVVCALRVESLVAHVQQQQQHASLASAEVSSSVRAEPRSGPGGTTISCTTFNILAPIYKRLGDEKVRESSYEEQWQSRNAAIIDTLLEKDSSLICLQEFWFNDGLRRMYEERLQQHGYSVVTLPRSNHRGDGLLAAVKSEVLQLVDYQPIVFNDCGDRVAQLLHLRLVQPDQSRRDSSSSSSSSSSGGSAGDGDGDGGESLHDILLVNTHLLFPHNANSSLIRLREVYKVLEFLERYKTQRGLQPLPIVLCGDLNGSKSGQVYRFLRSQGFVSAYDEAMKYQDTELRWVSHLNHHGEAVGVDYIWLLNPSAQLQPLTADWKQAVFGMIKAKLREAGLEEDRDAFSFFCSSNSTGCSVEEAEAAAAAAEAAAAASLSSGNGAGREDEQSDEHVTLSGFCYAVSQLGLTGEGTVGLTEAEMHELVMSADTDGNGVIDYDEFERIFRSPSMEDTYARIRQATGIEEAQWQGGPVRGQQQQQQQLQQQFDVSSLATMAAVETASHKTMSSKSTMVADVEIVADNAAGTKQGSTATAAAAAAAVAAAAEMDDHNQQQNMHQQLQQQDMLQAADISIMEAHLYPEEMGAGVWPRDYTLSDHAVLTAVFAV